MVAFAAVSCLVFPGRLRQAVVFFSSFSGTAVLNFSNYGMSPTALFLPFYLVWKILSGDALRPVRISRDHLLIFLPLVGFATVSVVALLVNQGLRSVQSIQLTQTAYVLFGVLITVVLSIDFVLRDRMDAAIMALRGAAVFVALWGVLQAVCHLVGLPYPEVFNNSNSHFADMFSQQAGEKAVRIASVATEPSVLAVSLMIFGAFGATLLTAEPRFRTLGWALPVVLALGVVAASTSTTGYFGLLVLTLLLAARRPGLVLVVGGILGTGAATVLALFPEVGSVIYGFTLAKTASSSYVDRSGAVMEAIPAIAQQPFLGWGWGGNFSYSIVTQLLASTGVIGTTCFVAAILATFMASRSARFRSVGSGDWRLRAYAQGTENALLVYLAESVITGFHFVVPDFWCLWALAIAIPSCLMCAQRTGSRANRAAENVAPYAGFASSLPLSVKGKS